MLKIATIFGTRAEILKLALLIPALDKEFNNILIHTNQHYSYNMDRIFFRELNLRDPDYNLNAGSGTHAEQTAKMIVDIEKVLLKEKPDLVIIQGDTNTTMAGALATVKLNIPMIHISAGNRSFNKKMPEEINRIIADHCADSLIVADTIAYNNLLKEGIPKNKIHLINDSIIDVVLHFREIAKISNILNELGLSKENYVLVTIHRAENTNNVDILKGLIDAINEVSKLITVVFPIHPRTDKIIKENNIRLNEKIKVIKPQGYLNFIKLLDNSLFVISDSGGLQKESAALNIPCLIIRNETEWTYLTDKGKTILFGTDPKKIISKSKELLSNRETIKKIRNIEVDLGSGFVERFIDILRQEFEK